MTSSDQSPRSLEPGIVTDLRDRLTYGGYLQLDRLLSSQQPLTGMAGGMARHDEMPFIIQHQVAGAWVKLMIHELKGARDLVRGDSPGPGFQDSSRGQGGSK